MENGDWGLGIGDWGLGPIPNPQSPLIYKFIFLNFQKYIFIFIYFIILIIYIYIYKFK